MRLDHKVGLIINKGARLYLQYPFFSDVAPLVAGRCVPCAPAQSDSSSGADLAPLDRGGNKDFFPEEGSIFFRFIFS